MRAESILTGAVGAFGASALLFVAMVAFMLAPERAVTELPDS